jgi:hypothetical protein
VHCAPQLVPDEAGGGDKVVVPIAEPTVFTVTLTLTRSGRSGEAVKSVIAKSGGADRQQN